MGAVKLVRNPQKGFVEATVGNGQPGPKTRWLRTDKPAILESGLMYSDHAGFTPPFFRRLLWQSGAFDALESEDFETARQRVMAIQFGKGKHRDILDALMALPPETRTMLIARSDEFAGGTGLCKSEYVVNGRLNGNSTRDMKELALLLEQAILRVLASEFTQDVVAFNTRLGITENMGVLLMPLHCRQQRASRYGLQYLVPLTLISSIGDLEMGIYNRDASQEKDAEIELVRIAGSAFAMCINTATGKREKIDLSQADYQDADLALTKNNVDRNIRKYNELVGPRYIEVLETEEGYGIVVQTAPYSFRRLTEPITTQEQEKIPASNAIGTKTVRNRNVRIIAASSNECNAISSKDIEYNRTHKDYIAVITRTNTTFAELTPSAFSNAAAIIITGDQNWSTLASHLDGWLRWLDIPVLQTKLTPEQIDRLQNNPRHSEVLVHANEFGKSFIAIDR